MAFASPGNMSPGGSFRAAPYSRAFAPGGPFNLLTAVSQAPNSCSGFLAIGSTALTYKDAAGTSVVIPVMSGVTDFAGISASEITSFVGGTVVAYWHGTGS